MTQITKPPPNPGRFIADEVSRTRIADWLETRSPWLRYTQALGWGLDRLHCFFGSPWSWRAFDRCLLLALLYPMLAILVGWVLGGRAGIVRESVIIVDPPFERRLTAATIILFSYFVSAVLMFNSERIARHVSRWLFKSDVGASALQWAKAFVNVLSLLVSFLGTGVADASVFKYYHNDYNLFFPTITFLYVPYFLVITNITKQYDVAIKSSLLMILIFAMFVFVAFSKQKTLTWK